MFSFKTYLIVVYKYGKRTPAYYMCDSKYEIMEIREKYNDKQHKIKVYKTAIF